MTIKWVQQDPLVMNGEPFCYGSRITVRQLLQERQSGAGLTELIKDHPELKVMGIAAAYAFAAGQRARYAGVFEPDGSLPITDVNTRFGGGFPVPLAAGGRYPELALALARGERPEPRLGDFQEGVVMTRYFSEVCLAPGDDGTLAVVHRP